MARELLYTWPIGKDRMTHAGYCVCTLRMPQNAPADVILKFDTAEKAVSSAERLGDGHAAFRLLQSKLGTRPHERIAREDLPVTEVLKLSK